jgi:hypothetical protein
VTFSPGVRFLGNIVGCVFFAAAGALFMTDSGLGGAWRWVVPIGLVLGFLGHWRGAYVARQERLQSVEDLGNG